MKWLRFSVAWVKNLDSNISAYVFQRGHENLWQAIRRVAKDLKCKDSATEVLTRIENQNGKESKAITLKTVKSKCVSKALHAE